jgi:hypothetical protein
MADLAERLWSHTVQPEYLGLADLGKLFEPHVPGACERPPRRLAQPAG